MPDRCIIDIGKLPTREPVDCLHSSSIYIHHIIQRLVVTISEYCATLRTDSHTTSKQVFVAGGLRWMKKHESGGGTYITFTLYALRRWAWRAERTRVLCNERYV